MSIKDFKLINQLRSNKNVFCVQLGENTFYINKKKINVGFFEVEDNLKGLVEYKKKFNPKEKIRISEISDSTFDLLVVNTIADNVVMELC